MNSRTKYSQNALSCALGGVNTEDQLNILDNMADFLKKFRVLHSTTGKIRTAKLPWEHGMLCSIKATKALYEDLVVKGPFEFLMTAKLNQDCLENLFSRIRGKLVYIIVVLSKKIQIILRLFLVIAMYCQASSIYHSTSHVAEKEA